MTARSIDFTHTIRDSMVGTTLEIVGDRKGVTVSMRGQSNDVEVTIKHRLNFEEINRLREFFDGVEQDRDNWNERAMQSDDRVRAFLEGLE